MVLSMLSLPAMPQPYPDLITRGIYRHYLDGQLYEVTGFVRDFETGDQLVIFRAHPPRVYLEAMVRPLDHFQDHVSDGEQRFTLETQWKRRLTYSPTLPPYISLACGHRRELTLEEVVEYQEAGLVPAYFLCTLCEE